MATCWTASLAEGDYDLTVEGVSAGTVTVFEPAADIAVQDAEVDPTEVETGEEATVTATVENEGDAEGSETIEFFVDDSFEESESVTLGAGEEEDVTFSFSRDDGGDYDLAVDDVSAGTVTVLEADIVVVSADVDPNEIEEGEEATVTATAENKGNTEGEEELEFTIDGEGEESATVTLAAGESDDVEFIFSEDEIGDYELAVEGVDAGTVTVIQTRISDYVQLTQEVELEGGEYETFVTQCPDDGRQALGGGVRVVGSGSDPTNTRVQWSAPGADRGGRSQWSVGVSNRIKDTKTLEVYAICAHPPRDFERVFESATLNSGEVDTLSPTCSSDNLVALGGGVMALEQGEPAISEPETQVQGQRVGTASGSDLWAADVLNESSSRREMLAIVLCAAEPKGYEKQDTEETLEPGEFTRMITHCSESEDEKVILSGGARAAGLFSDAGTRVQTDRPSEIGARPVTHLWATKIANESRADRDVISRVICSAP